MRNPTLHLVGIATSPGGGEVFGSRAEEELRQWLETRLDALGIDPVAYSRFVLSLLRRPDSALSPPPETLGIGTSTGRRIRTQLKTNPSTQGDSEQRHAVVQCLTSAAEHKYGIETLVDELCTKLKDLDGASTNDENEESKKSAVEPKTNLEALTPHDRALRYYAAFPALQSTALKISQKKYRQIGNSNNNNNNVISNNNNNSSSSNSNTATTTTTSSSSSNNNNNNNNNNINNKKNGISYNNNKNNRRSKKTKMSINIESQQLEDKESFGFAKSMEREREKERELELDQLKLAQLQAKFDESLEALWDSGPGNAQDTASIWAAPTLSIPSGPLWPTIIGDSPLIPWDIDLISIKDYTDDCNNKNASECNVNWSDSAVEGPWCWKGLDSSLGNFGQSRQTGSCFFPVAPRKSPIGTRKESRSHLKVNSLPEPDEDLLTSARTHFRPIRDDGHWADGTTFAVNNTLERVTYRRSESGNLLYLPGGESPYMEYRENDSPIPPASTNLTLKFRVRQCDKCVQTEPVRSPVKRRILSEQDHFPYPSIRTDETVILEQDKAEKDWFALGQVEWIQSSVPLQNDRKRRHSSSFGCQPLATLRPLTL